MIGNGEIFITALDSGSPHFLDAGGTIAPLRVHLQVSTQKFCPRRFGGEQRFRVRPCEKIASDHRSRRRFGRRSFNPFPQLPLDERTDSVQFGERAAACDQINRAFRPKKSAPCRAAKCAHANS